MGCGCGGGGRRQGNRTKVQQNTKKLKSASQRRNDLTVKKQRQIKGLTGALSPKQLEARDRIKKLRQQVIRKKFNK